MTVRIEIDEGADQARQVSKLWWLFQAAGVIWVVISFWCFPSTRRARR